ncbi:MAG: PAS domain-containing sensor histidine kinase [Pseudomonadota bacterium]
MAIPSSDTAAPGRDERLGGPHGVQAPARLSPAQAAAAAAPALFAVFGAALLNANGAPWTLAALAGVSAAPLAAAAAAAAGGALRAHAMAWASLPLALGASWTAWVTGGGLSPALPWVLAAMLGVGLFGGRLAPLAAGMGALLAGGALAVAPPPPEAFAPFRSADERALLALIGWGGAAFASAMSVWAARDAWADALPPLRHPTVLAREALGRLADVSATCALRVDGEGRVVQAIGSVERALDLPRGEIADLPLSEVLHPDDAAATATHLSAAHAAGAAPKRADGGDPGSFEPLTLRVRTRLGGYRWVEASFTDAAIFPTPGATGRSSGADAMLILRERWRPIQDDLNGSDTERGAFLAQVGGALREEVTEVVGYSEILKNELFGPLGGDRYREYARLAHDGGERLLERIEELLDLASLEAGAPLSAGEIADPTPLIDGVARLVRSAAAREGVAVKTEIPAAPPHVRIDRRALRRVLVTMMLDAVRHARLGDVVRLRVGSEDGAIHFTTLTGAAEPSGSGETVGAADPAPRDTRDPAQLVGQARFGRLVAQSLVERLGGALVFHIEPGEVPPAADPGEATLAEVLLPLEPGQSRDQPLERLQPIAEPKRRRIVKRAAVSDQAAPGSARPSVGASAVVAPPLGASETEETDDPLDAERQSEMARRFEEDLKRDRQATIDAAVPPSDQPVGSGANGGREKPPERDLDDVERPLFAPKTLGDK